jgi:hypothetical protein
MSASSTEFSQTFCNRTRFDLSKLRSVGPSERELRKRIRVFEEAVEFKQCLGYKRHGPT